MIRRNAKLLVRQRTLVVQPVAVPLVVLVLSALILGSWGDAWPVALVDRSNSPEGMEMIESIKESRSNISPYFRIIETEPAQAQSMVKAGRLQLLIEVPEDFARSKTLRVRTFNINSDATKNVRLRLDHAVNRYAAENSNLIVRQQLLTERPEDVPRSAFLGGSAFLLALFFGATLIAANLFAFERENNTRKEALLTPLHPALAAGIGIIITSVVAATATSMPTLLTAWWLFGLRPDPVRLASVCALMLPVMMGFAGLGVFLGQLLGYYRSIQPIVILTAITTFFVGGGFVGVAFLPPAARLIAEIWPFSRIFEWFNPVLHGFVSGLSVGQYTAILTAAFAGLALLGLAYRRERGSYTGGGR